MPGVRVAWYAATLFAGYLLMLTAGIWIWRLLRHDLLDDVFNDENESFMQETRLLSDEYSVNLPTLFRYRGQNFHGWGKYCRIPQLHSGRIARQRQVFHGD